MRLSRTTWITGIAIQLTAASARAEDAPEPPPDGGLQQNQANEDVDALPIVDPAFETVVEAKRPSGR